MACWRYGTREAYLSSRTRFGSANDNVRLGWKGIPWSLDAMNPARFAQDEHSRVSSLDLDSGDEHRRLSSISDLSTRQAPHILRLDLPQNR